VTRRLRWTPPTNLTAAPARAGLRVENAVAGGEDTAASLYIYDAIDSWGGEWGVSASEVVAALASVTAKRVDVHLNSPGGDYFEGVAIRAALMNHAASIHVYVDGMAASAASIIAMAGDRVTMAQGAQMMIHDPVTVSMGGAAQLRADADLLDKIAADIADAYVGRAGGDPKTWRKAMAAETWYSAAEAVAAGLADEVVGKPAATDPVDDAVAAYGERWIAAAWRYVGRDNAPAPEPTPKAAAPVVARLDLAAAVRAGVRAAAAPSQVRTKEEM
jgi:ATP-dependent protease ClpP protease subunit